MSKPNKHNFSLSAAMVLLPVSLIFSTISTVGQADSLAIPSDVGATRKNLAIHAPNRGMTMEQVLEQFGPPDSKISPVGNPPISRWVYPKFTVNFESDFVILSVIKK